MLCEGESVIPGRERDEGLPPKSDTIECQYEVFWLARAIRDGYFVYHSRMTCSVHLGQVLQKYAEVEWVVTRMDSLPKASDEA